MSAERAIRPEATRLPQLKRIPTVKRGLQTIAMATSLILAADAGIHFHHSGDIAQDSSYAANAETFEKLVHDIYNAESYITPQSETLDYPCYFDKENNFFNQETKQANCKPVSIEPSRPANPSFAAKVLGQIAESIQLSEYDAQTNDIALLQWTKDMITSPSAGTSVDAKADAVLRYVKNDFWDEHDALIAQAHEEQTHEQRKWGTIFMASLATFGLSFGFGKLELKKMRRNPKEAQPRTS